MSSRSRETSLQCNFGALGDGGDAAVVEVEVVERGKGRRKQQQFGCEHGRAVRRTSVRAHVPVPHT